MIVRYLTHPQVDMRPDVPVPDWGLSPLGRDRATLFSRSKLLALTKRIVSSAERKATETAQVIAERVGLDFLTIEGMHENDRSSTGFLKPHELEQVADAFFESPEKSVRGWETAKDAQDRIVTETEKLLGNAPDGDVLLVGHGGVGTLLYCHYAKVAISRAFDQKSGGGCVFSFERQDRRIVHAWKTIEELSEDGTTSSQRTLRGEESRIAKLNEL